MRILVVSDTHGNDSSLRRAILAQPKAEVVIHLGDGEEELLRAKRAFPEKMFLAVRGNSRASCLLMAAEGNGFEDVLTYYDHLMEHLRWDNLGHVLAGGNGDIGDIQGKPDLQQAFQLGASLR